MSSFFEISLCISEKLFIFVADLLIKTLKYVQNRIGSLCIGKSM